MLKPTNQPTKTKPLKLLMTMYTHFQKSWYFMTDFLNIVIPNQSILFPFVIKIPTCFQIRVKPHRGKKG